MPRESKETRTVEQSYEVKKLTFSSGEVIAALREKYDIPKSASIKLTAETYDADPWQSSVRGPGRLAARGTGAVATYEEKE